MKKTMREEYGPGTNQIEASLTLAQITSAKGVTRESLLNLHEKGEPIHCSICGAIAPREVRDQSRWAGICEARHRLEMKDEGAARSFPSSSRVNAATIQVASLARTRRHKNTGSRAS